MVELEDSDSSTESEEETDDNEGEESENCSEKDFQIGEVTTKNFVLTKPSSVKKPLIEDIT